MTNSVSRARTLALLAVAAWLSLNLVHSISGLRVASADDMTVLQSLENPTGALANRLLDYSIGRIYADYKFALLEHLMRLRSDALLAALRVAAFMAAVVAAAWFTWEWRRDWLTSLAVPIALLGFFQITLSYQALLYNPFLWLGWASILAMCALALRPESPATRGAILAAFALSLVMHESNVVFILAVPILHILKNRRFAPRELAREVALLGIIAGAYGGFSLLLRRHSSQFYTAYEGTHLALRPRDALFALGAYTLGGVPGVESWVFRLNVGSRIVRTPSEWFQYMVTWNSLASIASAILVGAAVWIATSAAKTSKPAGVSLPGMLGALCLAAFAPNLLLCLTVKYQMWAHQRMWPYYYTSASYMAWVLIMVVGPMALIEGMNRGVRRNIALCVFVVSAMLVSLSASATSREARTLLRMHPLTHMTEFREWYGNRAGGFQPILPPDQ